MSAEMIRKPDMKIITTSAQTRITRACGATSKRYSRLGDFGDFKFGNWFFLWFFFKNDQLSRRKLRSAFNQVSEFDRGRIVAYLDFLGKSVVVLNETKQL
ncbi:uncharacterized protein TNCV_2151831 [Trichonephila clavipes]|uniref:Uncharacterized protein n=1 Tax=Trichonephila clavipes TaxID=2585209 RepID=A0A8X6R401_TRICX|nr:uncharacterized protein TNCV_2151831 [Trichonephila clavipes]